MVNIRENSGDRPIRVTSSEQNSSVSVYHDIDNLYSGESKDWAIKMDGKVNNEDYSSKYWAADSKSNAEIAAGYAATASDIAETVAEKVAEALLYSTNSANSASAASASASSAADSKDIAEIWAEGTDEEVEGLGGVHSAKVWAELSGAEQIQADWSVSDTSSKAFIKNKPDLSVYLTSSALSGYAQTSDIPTKVSDLTNDSGFVTSSSLPSKTSDLTNDSGFITSSALSGYAQTSDIPTKVSDLTNDSGFVTSSSLPSKTSDLTNDSGFITSSALTNYALSSDIPTTASEVSALPNTTKYGNSLNYSNDTLSLVDQDGTTLDSVTITSQDSGASGSVSLPIGSQLLCDHVLTYDERTNLEPAGDYLYKTGLSGQYQGHSETYQKLLTEYQNAVTKIYLKSNITTHGSLYDNNGVLSGFNENSKYAQAPTTLTLGDEFEIVFKVKIGSDFNLQPTIAAAYNQIALAILLNSSHKIQISTGNGSSWGDILESNTTISANTDYKFKFSLHHSVLSIYIEDGNGNFVLDNSMSSTASIPNATIVLGVSRSLTAAWDGSIDLNESYININGTRTWMGTYNALQSENGRIFYGADIKNIVDAKYSSTGTAMMWGVDTTNERMILPRTNFYGSNGNLYFVV